VQENYFRSEIGIHPSIHTYNNKSIIQCIQKLETTLAPSRLQRASRWWQQSQYIQKLHPDEHVSATSHVDNNRLTVFDTSTSRWMKQTGHHLPQSKSIAIHRCLKAYAGFSTAAYGGLLLVENCPSLRH